MTTIVRQKINEIIDSMAREGLRTIAVAHRFVPNLTGKESPEDIEHDLVLDAIFGIKDPLRGDVKLAIKECQAAGIFVRMVTGDNLETAKAIARECGILTDGGVALEGPVFRKLTPRELDEILPSLQVLARSSPQDKHTLVTRLNGQNLPTNPETWSAVHPNHSWDTERDRILPGYLEEWKEAIATGSSLNNIHLLLK